LSLFDLKGNCITNIINDSFYSKGKHKMVWNSFVSENRVPSGCYILTLTVDDKVVSSKKIVKKY
ncbi:MAG: hypothetical protein U9R32_08700, partial [Bacteroidota bacterium]|nr:hypothetical protein [Bacteroidota bacterium]